MNEYPSKLKKDGKKVGYERFVYCDQREGYLKGKSLVPQHSKDGIQWEHIYLWDLKTWGNRCLVMWHKVMFLWCLWHIEGDYYFGSLESKQIIELIEDKKDA